MVGRGEDGRRVNPQQQNSETQAASSLSPSPPTPQGSGLQSVHGAPCVSVRGFWPTCHLPDLENTKSGASCLSPPNLKLKLFFASCCLEPSGDNYPEIVGVAVDGGSVDDGSDLLRLRF